MKIIVIDDEIYVDKLSAMCQQFEDIYKAVFETSNVNFYLEADIRPEDITSSIKFYEKSNENQILCYTEIADIQTILDFSPVLISFDLKNSSKPVDYLPQIRAVLQQKKPVFVIAVSGNIAEYEKELIDLTEEYPYFKYFDKGNLLENARDITVGCSAIKILYETANILKEKIEGQKDFLYKDFLINADIISKNPSAGMRHMTTVVKESLYDGKLLQEKHFPFESYLPIFSEEMILKCDKKQKNQVFDSDIRFGLILKNEIDNLYYINVTPTCNTNSIVKKSIHTIQLLKIRSYECLRDKELYKCPNDQEAQETCPEMEKEIKEIGIANSELFKCYKHFKKADCYHLLQELELKKKHVINFTQIQSLSIEEFLTQYKKICLLHESVARDIQQKFSAYYSRQGSIDFKK